MNVEIKLSRFLKRKELSDVYVDDRQKNEIRKVLNFLDSEENRNECLLRKQSSKILMSKMVKAGVDNLFLRRLFRHKKYSFSKVTLYGMLILYGRRGHEYWNDYCKKQAHVNTYEHKKEKYGWTKECFDSYNKNRAVTLENCIKKHGEEEGKKLFESYRKKQAYTNTYEYFIEKFNGDKDKAKEEIDRINRQKAITYENLIRKYKNEDKVLEILQRKNVISSFISKISIELFDNIYMKLPNNLKWKTYYGSLGEEFGKLSIEDKKYYFYDFVITNIRFCIEFNGDEWHANPKKYSSNQIPIVYSLPDRKTMKAKEIWEKDRHKMSLLEKAGFEVIIVWENNYKFNKERTIQKCLEKIYERSKSFNIQW